MDIKQIKDEFQELATTSGFVTNVEEASNNEMLLLVVAKRGLPRCLCRILSSWEINQKPHALKKIFKDMGDTLINHYREEKPWQDPSPLISATKR